MDEFERCPLPQLATQAQLAEGAGLAPEQVRHFSRGIAPTYTFGRVRVFDYERQYQILNAIAHADRCDRRGPKMAVSHLWPLLKGLGDALDAYYARMDREHAALVAAGLRQPEGEEEEAEEQLEEAGA